GVAPASGYLGGRLGPQVIARSHCHSGPRHYVLRTGKTVRTENVTAPRFARREERCVPGRYVSDE
ncbi:MAG: hypothetical protein M3454_07320, partial [Actinomycetota bacterium]|nr:hypothetical protein [Actinomycetota bacterium]